MNIEQIPTEEEFIRFAFRLTRDDDRAKDLLQESVYLVLKYRGKFVEGTNFTAWVKTIIRNAFISEYQKHKRRRELVARDQPLSGWFNEISTDNPAISNLEVAAISWEIYRLPEIYRRPLQLHLRGEKYREIALIIGMPIGTAKSRVHHAKKMLREILINNGVERVYRA